MRGRASGGVRGFASCEVASMYGASGGGIACCTTSTKVENPFTSSSTHIMSATDSFLPVCLEQIIIATEAAIDAAFFRCSFEQPAPRTANFACLWRSGQM